ncbi:hypothetical protein DFH06DRAFT_1147712 [Mycena polygramma]|nr:hypothetical protein DFH06DRAFT_1147712 [Mycena polygramma]
MFFVLILIELLRLPFTTAQSTADIRMWPLSNNCNPGVQFLTCSGKTPGSCCGGNGQSYESCLANPVYFSCCQLARTSSWSQSASRRSACTVRLSSGINCNSSPLAQIQGCTWNLYICAECGNRKREEISDEQWEEYWQPAAMEGGNSTDSCSAPDAVGTVVDGKEYTASLRSMNMTHEQAHAAIKAGTLEDSMIVAAATREM